MIRGDPTPQNFWRHCVLQLPATYNNQSATWDTVYKNFEVGAPVVPLLISLAVSWLFVCLTLAGGIKSSGKVVMVTATLPYFFLVVLFFRGITLEGADIGISYYLTPDMQKLKDPSVPAPSDTLMCSCI
jgi:SNF family Na+-dependent transporter